MVKKLTIDELLESQGTLLGPSNWIPVDQAKIDAFADATGDHQWIHVDPESAEESPYGSTIAHGLLTLSLLPGFLHQMLEVTDRRMAVNYGFDRVRFPAPVPSGSRIRASGEVTDVADVGGAVQVMINVIVEIEGVDKPACVAESVVRHLR